MSSYSAVWDESNLRSYHPKVVDKTIRQSLPQSAAKPTRRRITAEIRELENQFYSNETYETIQYYLRQKVLVDTGIVLTSDQSKEDIKGILHEIFDTHVLLRPITDQLPAINELRFEAIKFAYKILRPNLNLSITAKKNREERRRQELEGGSSIHIQRPQIITSVFHTNRDDKELSIFKSARSEDIRKSHARGRLENVPEFPQILTANNRKRTDVNREKFGFQYASDVGDLSVAQAITKNGPGYNGDHKLPFNTSTWNLDFCS